MSEIQNHIDQELWRSFLEGDNESLEKIYREYFDTLYQYGNKWLNDPAFTEDVIQELFVKLIRNRQNLSQAASVKYYLFKSFRYMALDKLKAQKMLVQMDELSGASFQIHLTPEHAMIAKQDYQLIKEKLDLAMATLTPRQREALYLMYTKNFAYDEIAEMMELTVKGTYKLMARAIAALRDAIGILWVVFILKKNWG